MATAATIILGDSQLSLFDQTELSPESAKKASEILQDNHLSNYIFYNMVGLHVRPHLPSFSGLEPPCSMEYS